MASEIYFTPGKLLHLCLSGCGYNLTAVLREAMQEFYWADVFLLFPPPPHSRGWGWCLDDAPQKEKLSLNSLLPGVLYSAAHQCRLQYGSGSLLCDDMDVRLGNEQHISVRKMQIISNRKKCILLLCCLPKVQSSLLLPSPSLQNAQTALSCTSWPVA